MAAVDQMIKSLELFMTVPGVFLGKTNANRGIRGGSQLWGTSQGSKLMNLLLVWRTQKPCSALQWHIERRELLCKNTQLYM